MLRDTNPVHSHPAHLHTGGQTVQAVHSGVQLVERRAAGGLVACIIGNMVN